jgi:hypothetical protein
VRPWRDRREKIYYRLQSDGRRPDAGPSQYPCRPVAVRSVGTRNSRAVPRAPRVRAAAGARRRGIAMSVPSPPPSRRILTTEDRTEEEPRGRRFHIITEFLHLSDNRAPLACFACRVRAVGTYTDGMR